MMSNQPQYSYAPLSSSRHTRLVILHPSETDNYPIVCKLVEVDIDNKPVYEALSYTWNNEAPSKPLEIVSADGSSPRCLLITTNCARALRLLRKRIGKRPIAQIGLWVDAISINQSFNEERNAQVTMMAEIYQRARNVVVWLGNSYAPPSRRSMLPLHLSRPFSSYQQDAWSKTWKLRWINRLCSVIKPVAKNIVKKGSARVLRLFNSPYWTRAWTLQEYPHSSTKILCLNSEYSSTLGMHSVAEVLDADTDIHLHHQLFEINRREELSQWRSRMLSMNLPSVIDMKCSDPRDKVFALRELFLGVFGGIAVDYNRTVEDIFTEATRCLILASQNLEALYTSCSCRKLYDVLGPQEEPYDIPSWAIDWTGASEGGLYRFTDGDLREEMSWFGLAILSGFLYDEVNLPASFSDDGLRLNLFGNCFSQVSKCVSDKIVYHTDPRIGAKVFVTVVRKFLNEAAETQFTSTAPLGSAMAKLLRLIYSTSDSEKRKKAESQMEVESDVDRICDLMGEDASTYGLLMRRRRLFVTTDGNIGTGNSDVVPGDLICNFAGLNMPFVVREKGEHHELISPAIVIGAMHREMWPEDHKEIVPWEII